LSNKKEANKEGGKEMVLRCIIKKSGAGFVGICLELSLAAKGRTPSECRKNLSRLINDYIETMYELVQKGDHVVIRRVEFYLFKKILFDIQGYLHRLIHNDKPERGFIQKTVVPVGV
jgi:predicted RNase H-like HicB family nuclease